MSDKQLTVAELLAKAGKDSGGAKDGAERPRRRRRSLEEGGISVAELTGNIPRVDKKPVESKHSSVPIDEPEKAQEKKAQEQKASTPSDDDTSVLSKVTDEDIQKQQGAKKPAPAKPAPAKADETTVLPAVDPEKTEDRGGSVAKEDAGQEITEQGGDEKISIASVLLLALVGIVIGVVVFLGFQMLWERFNKLIVGVLALVVTGVMVGVVHSLRPTKDGVSMGLAIVAGLVMTFGPLAVVLM